MSRTPRVPDADAVGVGSLLVSPSGDLFVVTRHDGGHYSTAELEDVQNFAGGGEMYEDRYAPDGWGARDYPQTSAGTAPAEVVDAIRAVEAHAAAVREVMADVDPARHRTLVNAMAGARHWRGKVLTDPAEAGEYARLLAREVEKITAVVGSLASAATLLGTDEESLRHETGA
ncbi:hypothetical protein [Streptomyces sp. NPDC001781]